MENTFGRNLNIEIAKNNIKKKEISKFLNCHPSTISKWINGTSTPDPETIFKLAEFLNVSCETLLTNKI